MSVKTSSRMAARLSTAAGATLIATFVAALALTSHVF